MRSTHIDVEVDRGEPSHTKLSYTSLWVSLFAFAFVITFALQGEFTISIISSGIGIFGFLLSAFRV